jgi:hypothetical protein
MTSEPATTELILHDDARLLAAVGAVVSFSSTRCGLSQEAQDGLSTAAVQACRETFPLLSETKTSDPEVKMIVSDYPDRVEVAIEHSGEALPTAGLHTFAGNPDAGGDAGLSSALQNTSVDRVQYETRDGVSRMTLIKYCPRKATV